MSAHSRPAAPCRLRAPFLSAGLLCTVVLATGCAGSRDSNGEGNRGDLSGQEPSAIPPRCQVVDGLSSNQHMVTSWRTAPTDAIITHPISGLTVRQFLAPHRSGEVMRLRLSNRYSSLPVTLESLHIALEVMPGAPELVPGSECPLSFDGRSSITIPPGEAVLTDRIAFPIRAFERIGISFFVPAATPQITRHLNANEILFLSYPGNHAVDPRGTQFQPVPDGYASNFLAIEALEVAASTDVTTIVTVGDSITDGSGSTTQAAQMSVSPMTSTDQRYPDHLQRRLDETGLRLTVANAGIGGNELLGDGWLPQFGVSLLKRFDHDVLAVAGASHILLMIGTNDFGNPQATGVPSAEDVIAGFTQLIDRAHAAGKKLLLGTIPPAEGAVTDGLPVVGGLPADIDLMHGTPAARRSRDAVNAWIRGQRLSDGVVDFDACLEDPQRPGYLAPEYNSGDNLHPSPAGYAAMAACVDLNLFRDGAKTP